MREVRQDPLTGDTVVLVTERPFERRPAPLLDPGAADCPFCPGHEAHTAPTIAARRDPTGWVARAFANRRPVLVVEEPLAERVDGPYAAVSGTGAHEVVVEAPEHAPLHHLPERRSEDALQLAVERARDLRGDSRLAVVQWFRNHGVGAGASQAHPHAQLVGLPVVPRRIGALVERATAWRARRGGALLDAVVDAERRAGARVLHDGDGVVAFCAWAPRHPYEVWVVPGGAPTAFADAAPDTVAAVARAVRAAARALDAALGPVPTTTVALGPPHVPGIDGVGWHVRVAPRLAVGGGLEDATGAATHSMVPDAAAAELRAVWGG